jgi:hypothetical protein
MQYQTFKGWRMSKRKYSCSEDACNASIFMSKKCYNHIRYDYHIDEWVKFYDKCIKGEDLDLDTVFVFFETSLHHLKAMNQYKKRKIIESDSIQAPEANHVVPTDEIVEKEMIDLLLKLSQ